MNDNAPHRLTPTQRQLFATALGLIFLLLVFRNTGLYPFIMSDEWSYSSMARLMPLADVTVPSYLYFAVFGATSSCGDGFLDCARLFNAVALVSAAPFIYLLTRRYATPAASAIVAVLAILAPINIYTAFFMPEISYFLGFWVLTWLVFHLQDHPGMPRALLVGAVFGLLAMVKMHALFLLPALCLYLFWISFEQGGAGWFTRAIAMVLAMLAAALAVRLGLGYLLAGKPALNLVGTLYQGQSDYATQGKKPLLQLLSMTLGNLGGHLLGLAMLSAMPLAALGSQLGSRAAMQPSPRRSLAIYTLLMLGNMVAVTALFTATVAGAGPFESADRLHLRYYSFTLPLLAMLAASQADVPDLGRTQRLLWGLLAAAALACAWRILPADFTANIVDNPELLGLITRPALLNATALAGLACLLAWIWRPRQGGRAFVLLFLPLSTLIGGVTVAVSLRNNIKPDVYDKAGMYVRQYLTPDQAKHLVIAGDNHGGLFKVKYHTDNIRPELLLLSPGQPLDTQSLPAGTRWLLAMGDHPDMPGLVHLQNKEFALSEILAGGGSRYHIDFGQDEHNGYLHRTDGLSEVGGSGRWSVQKDVTMEFVKPLPRQLTLTLTAWGYGPNAGQEAVVQVGEERQTFKLGAEARQSTLQFRNGADISRLSIIAPRPVSPKELGQSGDPRTLGVFLINMDISSSDPAERERLEHDSSALQR
jgi:phosphoglycerol transferase